MWKCLYLCLLKYWHLKQLKCVNVLNRRMAGNQQTSTLVFGPCNHEVEYVEGSLPFGLPDTAGLLQQVYGRSTVKGRLVWKRHISILETCKPGREQLRNLQHIAINGAQTMQEGSVAIYESMIHSCMNVWAQSFVWGNVNTLGFCGIWYHGANSICEEL